MGSLDAALEYVRVDPQGRIVDVAGRRKKTVVPQATSVYVGIGTFLLGSPPAVSAPQSPPYPIMRVPVGWRRWVEVLPCCVHAS
jgi:hypothetical protein